LKQASAIVDNRYVVSTSRTEKIQLFYNNTLSITVTGVARKSLVYLHKSTQFSVPDPETNPVVRQNITGSYCLLKIAGPGSGKQEWQRFPVTTAKKPAVSDGAEHWKMVSGDWLVVVGCGILDAKSWLKS
jgi:hypothetical protein